jgi:hypothetical protein
MASSSSSSSAANYYANIKSKWMEEYPSSETIDDTWSFYKECGYKDPAATLRSMLDHISFSKNRILDYGCDKGLMTDFFCSSLEGAEGFGVDINEEAIAIPFPEHFDCVIAVATIKHVRYEDRDEVYAELNRVADYALLVEADEKEKCEQSFQGWTFYNSNFSREFEQSFVEPVKVVREGGDILGLYKCKRLEGVRI